MAQSTTGTPPSSQGPTPPRNTSVSASTNTSTPPLRLIRTLFVTGSTPTSSSRAWVSLTPATGSLTPSSRNRRTRTRSSLT